MATQAAGPRPAGLLAGGTESCAVSGEAAKTSATMAQLSCDGVTEELREGKQEGPGAGRVEDPGQQQEDGGHTGAAGGDGGRGRGEQARAEQPGRGGAQGREHRPG